MMRKRLLITIVLLWGSTSSIAQSVELTSSIEDFASKFPGFSLSVIEADSLVYEYIHGYSDVREKTSVSADTKFNIYSTSKFITGVAFLKLVSDSIISDLSTSVVDIDPSLPAVYNDITLNHLLTHRSGIRHYQGGNDWRNFSYLRCSSPADAVAYFKNDPLEFEAGTDYRYSTFGMALASHLLEIITGKSYVDALNEILPISEPLELDSEHAHKATPYVKRFFGLRNSPYHDLSAECKYGGGGLIASSKQLAEVGALLFNESFLEERELKELVSVNWQEETQSGVSYAMGSGIAEESFGNEPVMYFNMSGGSPGGRSYVIVLAEKELSIALTGNLEVDGQQAYELVLSVAKAFAL